MEHSVKAPEVGESITEVRILKWLKSNGEAVNSGDILVEIETDKASVEVTAESSGSLRIIKEEGETVPVGEVLAVIDDSKQGTAGASKESKSATAGSTESNAQSAPEVTETRPHLRATEDQPLSPSVRRLAAESRIDLSQVEATGPGGRLRKEDLLRHLATQGDSPSSATTTRAANGIGQKGKKPGPATKIEQVDRPGDRRVEMTRIRRTIAERLVYAQQTAAILTTFNEVDLSEVMKLRKQHKQSFQDKYDVKLSYMSFFTRACTIALQEMPDVNASIDGNDIIYHDYCDIGIAVGTERGLVVPVIRNAHEMGFADIEKSIGTVAEKARNNKLTLQEMSGGTFTISNGGTYGSLLSTPILNPPQSGILGMHKIQDRPVAIDGKVEIRPMMYLALSYDHRLIDGKGAVTFLVRIRELLENPEQLNLEWLNG